MNRTLQPAVGSSSYIPQNTAIDTPADDEDPQRIVFDTPTSIDSLLSKELLQLSLRDRTAIDEEIHGVSTLAPEESPEFLENSLRQLSRALDKIPVGSKISYLESQVLTDSYVNESDFRLRFLRCELFDAKKAANRMVKFLDFASSLFGPIVLQRPMRITDFTRNEKKYLTAGLIQILPYRDQTGRPVYWWIVDSKLLEGDVVSRNKLNLYMKYCISDDLESQRKGVTLVVWVGSNDVPMPGWENFEYNKRAQESIPLRKCSTHWCLPNNLPYLHPLHTVRCGHALASGKKRVKFHVGEKIELMYKLKTYGIPVEWIPITETGNIKTTNLKQWLRFRKHVEEARAKGTPDAFSITLCPRSTDVAFRGGTSLKSHPGNLMFESIIEEKLKQHSSASQKEKVTITKEIINTVRKREGRFLIWDNRGWWEELKDSSQIHSKVAEKVRTLTSKMIPLQEKSYHSCTFVFQNQDNSKRRKLISRDDSDGSNSVERCCLL